MRAHAILGGGCFWCLEAVFRRLKGVENVVSGYAGGASSSPTYQAVCSGNTGHAEVVRVTFNPKVLPYSVLLDVFFGTHDPTTLNRQGADVGTQYRSVIFTTTPEQFEAARAKIVALEASNLFGLPVVTQALPAPEFWPAEREHVDYFERNSNQPYCARVITPKLTHFRLQFESWLKPEVF